MNDWEKEGNNGQGDSGISLPLIMDVRAGYR